MHCYSWEHRMLYLRNRYSQGFTGQTRSIVCPRFTRLRLYHTDPQDHSLVSWSGKARVLSADPFVSICCGSSASTSS
jgi:hypothetical protein